MSQMKELAAILDELTGAAASPIRSRKSRSTDSAAYPFPMKA